MKKSTLLASILLPMVTFSQSFIQTYQDRANEVTQNNITTLLQEFENLGVKTTGNEANNNTREWIKNKYLSFGYSEDQISEHTFSFSRQGQTVSSKNLILTKTGTVYPKQFVIICGHFDSIVGPGTNDNGTGTSIILEVARILKEVPTEYSIKFINFSGEEQGLLGSYAYVDDIVNATSPKMDIKVVFNIDEVGGIAGQDNSIIYCDVDQSSPYANNSASSEMAHQLAAVTELYSDLETDFDPAYGTDYVPFQENGEIITGFFEYHYSPYAHSTQDVLENLDQEYVYQIAKAAVGAAQHFAIASSENLSTSNLSANALESIKIYPNPAKDVLHFQIDESKLSDFSIEIHDLSGRFLMEKKSDSKIDISSLKSGNYLVTIRLKGEKFTKKIIVE